MSTLDQHQNQEPGPDGASALILHGLVHRSIEHVAASLRRYVIAPLERLGPVDIYFASWDLAVINNPRGNEHQVRIDLDNVHKFLPEAKGVFHSQEEFDRSIDWAPLFERNPMRHCTSNEQAAQATLMNFRRSLESQQQAWRFFEKTRTRKYNRIVATRPDLKFLHELEIPPDLVSVSPVPSLASNPLEKANLKLWVPKFHGWGGVNDRFAIGSESAIKVWSNRADFADGWLLNPGLKSSEWLLMKWLERNHSPVHYLDLVFQRIRSDGNIAEMDRGIELRPAIASHSTPDRSNQSVYDQPVDKAPKNERFLILTRHASMATESLLNVLSPHGRVEVILDHADPDGADRAGEDKDRTYFYISDKEAEGFGGLMSKSASFPSITSWSRALFHLSRTLEENDAVWFVEDDVAGDAATFANIVTLTKASGADLAAVDIRRKITDGKWGHWPLAENFFSDAHRAFQPLCRLSSRLIRKILDFRQTEGKFIFHEILFPSIASENSMIMLNWSTNAASQHHFTNFRYRPLVDVISTGICHPVKNTRIHHAICSLTKQPISDRADFYSSDADIAWFRNFHADWKHMFFTIEPVKIMEVGTSDGASANLLLDEIFVDPASELHCIDSYGSDSGVQALQLFEDNAQKGLKSDRLYLYDGQTTEILTWMAATGDFDQGFDLVHLNKREDPCNALLNICQIWSLLKSGGVLVFGLEISAGIGSPEGDRHPAVNAFLQGFKGQFKQLDLRGHLAVFKIP